MIYSKQFSIRIDMFQAWDVEPNCFYPITTLAFATSFFLTKVHNMLSMMLDLKFKGMKVVRVCGNHEMAQGIMKEYGEKIVLPLLI
jgi:hypothetical protein